MKTIHEIAVAAERFYERTMHAPDFVIVGTMEWGRMSQEMRESLDSPAFGLFGHVEVGTEVGMIKVRCDRDVYSMIAPILKSMP